MRPPASPSRLYPPGRSPLPLRDGVEPEAIGVKGPAPRREVGKIRGWDAGRFGGV